MHTLEKMLLLSVALLASCEPIEGSGEPEPTEAVVGVETSELWGQLSFVGCSAAETQRLRDTVDYIKGRVGSLAYLKCLRDAFGVEAEGQMAEHVAAASNSIRDMEFTCEVDPCGASVACAGFDPTRETMTVQKGWVTATSVEDLGPVVVHEMMHNHGWFHDHFYGPTWPDQALVCLDQFDPWGTSRDDLGGQVALTPLGGDGGAEGRQDCGHGAVAVGAVIATNHDSVTRVAPRCQQVEGDQLVGAVFGPAINPPAGSNTVTDLCPANQVLVGMGGYADHFVRATRVHCAPLATVRGSQGVNPTVGAWRGFTNGRFTSRTCKQHAAVVGFRTQTGAVLDRLEVECDDFPIGDRRFEAITWGVGNWGGSDFRRDCEGHGVLTGVYGQTEASGFRRTLGGVCQTVSRHADRSGDEWGWSVHYTDFAGTEMNQDDVNSTRRCMDGQVMVGLATTADPYIRKVSPICANWSSWRDGSGLSGYSMSGDGGRPVYEERCPVGEVAIALYGRDGWLIDRVGLVCAEPDPSGTLRRLPVAGGTGGDPWEEVCPQARTMVGIDTRAQNDHLVKLTGACGRHTPTESSWYGGVRLPTQMSKDADVMDNCAHGSVLVGLEIGTNPSGSGGYVDSVRARCASEQAVTTGQPAPITMTPRRGDATPSSVAVHDCPNGEVVRGLRGRRAGWQDQLGVVCGKPTLRFGAEVAGGVGGLGVEVWPLLIPATQTGRLQIEIDSPTSLRPKIRVRRGLEPNAESVDFELVGNQGSLDLNRLATYQEDLYFIEVGAHQGFGSYEMRVNFVPQVVRRR